MRLTDLIEGLSRPGAYPHPVDGFEVHHTHISVVFLAGEFAYKVKKPVDLGFLDFTTLEKRLRFCREEVRLNRRLAPEVYLGVVPILRAEAGPEFGPVVFEGRGEDDATAAPDGRPGRAAVPRQDAAPTPDAASHVDAAPTADAVEYAVKMRRLPPDARLLARLRRNEVEAEHLRSLARRLARFHARAASGERISAFGRFPVVAGNARENLEQARPHIGETIAEPVHRRLSERTEAALERLRPLIEARAEADVPRDTHGDLHLDHVYLFPDRTPPRDVVVIDCIEFNERFRYADPVADMAFLAMDLVFHHRPRLAEAFSRTYFAASEDAEGAELLPFYVAYRAAVRGKVEGMMTEESEVPEDERRAAIERARAHWLLALAQLEEPGRRPCLVLVGGLPGSGKSTLARRLGERAGFRVLSSDRVRKELAGLPPDAPAAADFGAGLYTEEWNERTYDALANRAAEGLYRGERILVDASFRAEAPRRTLLEVAERLGLPSLFLVCEAPDAEIRRRLEERRPGREPSDADWGIYLRAKDAWDAPSPKTARRLEPVDTGREPGEAEETALAILREVGLAD